MPPRIAIPEPVSGDREYNERSLPQYIRAVEEAGGEAQVISLELGPEEVARVLAQCDAALLPGSPADVDPQKFSAARGSHTSAADPRRDAVDELVLQDAYNLRKPILGICYGLQSLNVWRTGTLVQHITSSVNHEAGRKVERAHRIAVEPESRLARILGGNARPLLIEVNSSHHQAAEVVGDGLRVVARCPDDGVVEAIESTAPGSFVLAVQWHPERSTETDERSRAIFREFVKAAAESAD